METTDDTIVESYGVELTVNRITAHFRVRQAMRKYVEEDRILIAWRMTLDPVEFLSQPTSGVHFYERGYILLKRSATKPRDDFSVMQTTFIMTPQWFEQSAESIAGQVSNFLVDCSVRRIDLSHQKIEMHLLDESLKRGHIVVDSVNV